MALLFRNLILGIAIFILTIFVGVYGINTFYGKAPEYNDYCPMVQPQTASECVKQNGTWINYTDQQIPPQKMAAAPVTSPTGYCDYTLCQKEFDKAQEPYYKAVFMIALPLGIVIIAIGLFAFALEAVGLGLMAGGVGLIIYGAGQYWRFSSDVIKFTLSAIGLVALIILAYYFNQRFHWNMFGKKKEETKEEVVVKKK